MRKSSSDNEAESRAESSKFHRSRRSVSRRARVMAVLASVVVVALSAAGCSKGSTGKSSSSSSTPSHTGKSSNAATVVLESPAKERYKVSRWQDDYSVSSSKSNSSPVTDALGTRTTGSIAEGFWDPEQAKRLDQQVCVTMKSVLAPSTTAAAEQLTSNAEMAHTSGVVLRALPGDKTTGAQAIVVAQNLALGALWRFNVALVSAADTKAGLTTTTRTLASLDFSDALGTVSFTGARVTQSTLASGPWDLCARIIGTTLNVKVWPHKNPEPPWGDAKNVKNLDVPPNWVYQGFAGGYEAQLRPGRESEFGAMDVSSPY